MAWLLADVLTYLGLRYARARDRDKALQIPAKIPSARMGSIEARPVRAARLSISAAASTIQCR